MTTTVIITLVVFLFMFLFLFLFLFMNLFLVLLLALIMIVKTSSWSVLSKSSSKSKVSESFLDRSDHEAALVVSNDSDLAMPCRAPQGPARAVISGRAKSTPKLADGQIEMLRQSDQDRQGHRGQGTNPGNDHAQDARGHCTTRAP